MEQEKYLNRFIRIYPILKGFTDDLLFFIAIDTLFFTVAKGLSARQIVLLTTISSFCSIIFRVTLVKLIRKIGNTKSVRFGMGLLLLSAILITFASSYFWIIIGKIIYEIAWVFKDMENVMLKNNLGVVGKDKKYAQIANRGMVIYAFLTLIVSLMSGFLFNLSPYIPMYLCIIICIISFIIYFYMRDISKYNITYNEKVNPKKVKLSKLVWIILVSYAIFYAIITPGQENSKLLIQYELFDLYDIGKVSTSLGIIVASSRMARLLGNIAFGKIYYRIKDKSLILLTTTLFTAFIFILIGYFIQTAPLRFLIMSIGFCIILAVRDPFRLYKNDVILKLVKPEEQQVAISYIQFARKFGATICSLLASAILLKWHIIYVIIGIGALSIIEVFIAIRLYSILKNYNNNINKTDSVERGEKNEIIYN